MSAPAVAGVEASGEAHGDACGWHVALLLAVAKPIPPKVHEGLAQGEQAWWRDAVRVMFPATLPL